MQPSCGSEQRTFGQTRYAGATKWQRARRIMVVTAGGSRFSVLTCLIPALALFSAPTTGVAPHVPNTSQRRQGHASGADGTAMGQQQGSASNATASSIFSPNGNCTQIDDTGSVWRECSDAVRAFLYRDTVDIRAAPANTIAFDPRCVQLRSPCRQDNAVLCVLSSLPCWSRTLHRVHGAFAALFSEKHAMPCDCMILTECMCVGVYVKMAVCR